MSGQWNGPGDGWQPADDHWGPRAAIVQYDEHGNTIASWTPTAPPLDPPTDKWTVIRFEWGGGVKNGGSSRTVVRYDNAWRWGIEIVDVTRATGYTVLASPFTVGMWSPESVAQAVKDAKQDTAATVLDRVYGKVVGQDSRRNIIAKEFGVDQ